MRPTDAIVRRLTEQGVRLVALGWVDSAGISRVKAVPVRRLPHAARWGVGTAPVFDTYLADDTRVLDEVYGGRVGDLRLMPDPARLVPLAARPGWAWAPADRFGQDGAPYPGCHRSFAARMAPATRPAPAPARSGRAVPGPSRPTSRPPRRTSARTTRSAGRCTTRPSSTAACALPYPREDRRPPRARRRRHRRPRPPLAGGEAP